MPEIQLVHSVIKETDFFECNTGDQRTRDYRGARVERFTAVLTTAMISC